MEAEYCPRCFKKLGGPAPGRLCPGCGFDPAADPQPQTALPWYTLLHDRYLAGRVLGQGGFGITYVGFDTNLQCKVAIKEYYPRGVAVRDASQSRSLKWPDSQDSREKEHGCERFLREARKMARIVSIPGIVRVTDTFEENDTAYIVMDYVEGITLRQYIASNGPMSFDRCFEMLRPLCASIGRIHRQSILHRDISPDNIMLRGDGTVWLLDFGAAKDLEDGAGTESSTLVAKRGFSPAEQYSNSRHFGPWTDVYALCATMYYCVSGQIPPDAIDRMMGDNIRWDILPVPEDIRSTLRQGLAVRDADRIQNIPQLVERLEASIYQTGGGEPTELKKPAESKEPMEFKEPTPGSATEVVTAPMQDGPYGVSVDPAAEAPAKQKQKDLIKKAAAIAAAAVLVIGGAAYAFTHLGGDTAAAGDQEEDQTTSDPADAAADADAGTETADETYVTDRSFTNGAGYTYTYTGDVSGGKPNGTGTGVFSGNGASVDGTYEGTWTDGEMDGSGKYIWNNGGRYTGEWKNGQRDGTGTYTRHGSTYEGEWKNDMQDGTGTYTYIDGHKYEGTFKSGRRSGTGTMTYDNGNRYEGEWKNDKQDGTGTYTWANGDKYTGGWAGGLRHGWGIMTYANGDRYEGEWKDDKPV